MLWSLAGAIPLLLYLTGLLRWLHLRGWIDDRPARWPSRLRLQPVDFRHLRRLRGPVLNLVTRLRTSLITALLALQRHLERLSEGSQRKGD